MPTGKSKSKSRSKGTKKGQAPSRKPDRRHHAALTGSHSSSRPHEINENMSLIELQKIARSRGIPFGGLRKSQLIRKILTY